MATDQFGSGGGFSATFDQTHAQWQAKAVAAYVKKSSSLASFPPKGSFEPLGRATPDVSALGEGFQVACPKLQEATALDFLLIGVDWYGVVLNDIDCC